jgi:phage terminase large subunit-like protein
MRTTRPGICSRRWRLVARSTIIWSCRPSTSLPFRSVWRIWSQSRSTIRVPNLVREITAERVQFHDLIDFIRSAAVRWNYDGKLEVVLIEDKGSGISALQQLRAAADPPWLAGMLRGFEPPGSKEYRARKAAIWPKRDMVLLPHPSAEAPWLLDFAGPEPQGQLFKFPNVEHDDEVDAFSQLIDYLWEILAEGYRAKGGVAA